MARTGLLKISCDGLTFLLSRLTNSSARWWCVLPAVLLWTVSHSYGQADTSKGEPSAVDAPAAEPAKPKPATPETEDVFLVSDDVNLIHRGDGILIQVLGHELLKIELVVPQSGNIRMPMVGTIRVSDISPVDLAETLRRRLQESGQLANPDVTVLITHYARKRIFIYGSVTSAQQISIPRHERLRLSQAIAIVGGFLGSADRSHVKLIRRIPGRAPLFRIIDVDRVTKEEHLAEDIELIDADTVVVGSQEKVYIMGRVNRPGAYTISREAERTLVKAIGLAGGFAPRAGSNRVQLFQPDEKGVYTVITVDAKELLEKGQLNKDLPLKPGSIIHVPAARW